MIGGKTLSGPDKGLYPYYRHSRKAPAGIPCAHYTIHECALDDALWQWLTEVASDPDEVERQLTARQHEAEQRNVPIHKQIAILDKQIAEFQRELDDLQMWLTIKRKITEEVFDRESRKIERQLTDLQQRRKELAQKLEQGQHTPEQIQNARQLCTAIRLGLREFETEERREGYDLLDVTAQITIEDGMKVAYADCILDARRLPIGLLGNTAARSAAARMSRSLLRARHPSNTARSKSRRRDSAPDRSRDRSG
jgi:hypothetical protein